MLGFQPCVVEIGGQFPEKWWRVAVCPATILWVQLRERGQEKEIKKCCSLLLPCSLITGWSCGCFWALGFFLREGWWTKKDVKTFCSGKILMQVQSHVQLHPQIFCGYTTCCDAWGPGRRLTGASLLKYIYGRDYKITRRLYMRLSKEV